MSYSLGHKATLFQKREIGVISQWGSGKITLNERMGDGRYCCNHLKYILPHNLPSYMLSKKEIWLEIAKLFHNKLMSYVISSVSFGTSIIRHTYIHLIIQGRDQYFQYLLC